MRGLWIIGVMLSGAVWARDCPVDRDDDLFREKVATAIRATDTCVAAVLIAEACASGNIPDEGVAVTAERKCGLDFWTQLTSADKRIYNNLQARCDARYIYPDGQMSVSMMAFCRLRVARLFSEIYSKPGG